MAKAPGATVGAGRPGACARGSEGRSPGQRTRVRRRNAYPPWAGGGSSATSRNEMVSSSSWKCGLRNATAL